MLIWINGAFGVGKTTTSRLVADETARRLFDPEYVGYLLLRLLPDHDIGDFQDLPAWRRLVPAVISELITTTGDDLIVVQTVLAESYWRELRAGLAALDQRVVHVVLDADADTMHRRIDADTDDPGAAEWRHGHVAQYEAARTWLRVDADLFVDTGDRPAAEVAARISAAIR